MAIGVFNEALLHLFAIIYIWILSNAQQNSINMIILVVNEVFYFIGFVCFS